MLSRINNKFHLSAILLVFAFMALGLSYSLIVPLWEAPDEVGHFYFIAHLKQNRTLPVQQIGALGEAHQPVLYYAIALLATLPANLDDPTGIFTPNPDFMWAGKGGNDINAGLHGSAETFPFQGWALGIHLARITSVLMAALTIAFTIAIAWDLFPNHKSIGILAAAFVAFNPEFIFISSVVNNDNLLTLATTGGLWQLLRTIKTPERMRQWIYAGLWVGVAILAKLSGFVLAGIAGLVLLICALQKRSLKLFLQGALAMLVMVGFITGWWFVRNQILYGDPLGWQMYKEVFAVNIRTTPLQTQDYYDFFSTQLRSFWGLFGWANVSAPTWFYSMTQGFSFLGFIGLIAFCFRIPKYKFSSIQKSSTLLLIIAVLMQEVYMLTVITQCNASCYHGRYLFPIIGPLMILLTVGLGTLLAKWLRTIVISMLALFLFVVSIFILFEVIQPAYEIAALPKSTLNSITHPTEYNFGSIFALKGYDLSTSLDESTSMLTLYWEATQKPDFDYSAFVHLIDQSEQIVAQEDHAPGQDVDFLPTKWLIGDIIADKHTIQLPSELLPGTYRLRVGLYNWSTGEQLPVSFENQSIGPYIILEDTVQIE